MGSSGSGVEDSCCAVEECRVEETGLAWGGIGKREYLDFFLSIKAESWGKKGAGATRSKHGGERKSGAGGWEMEERRCGE